MQVKVGTLLQFTVLPRTGMVLCTSTPEATLGQVRYWFLQKILPFLLLLRRPAAILHAGAVAVGDSAAAFLAPSGTGKSTLVHYFVNQGHALIADEHLVIAENSASAIPSIPYLRPFRALECLGDHTDTFSDRPLTLRSFYLLEKAAPDAEITVERLSGGAASIELCVRQQIDLNGLFQSAEYRQLLMDRFANVVSLPGKVPVKRIRVPRCLDRLPEVYSAIRRDMNLSNA